MVRIRSLLDILTYCIALVGYLPLFPYLETVPRVILPATLAAGYLGDRKGKWLAGHLPTIVSILSFLYYAARISMSDIVRPSVNLLILLLAVRMISEKRVRNYLQIFALSLFCMAGSSLYTLDAYFLLYLILLLVLVAVALVVLAFYGSDSEMKLAKTETKAVLSAGFLMPAATLPLIAVFFIILPRTQYPLWDFLNSNASRSAGFSEQVRPGSSNSVAEVKEPVFRVRCERLDKSQLYWRGIVLNSIRDNDWAAGGLPEDESGRAAGGMPVHQTFYKSSVSSGYLFTLNLPIRVSGVRGGLSGDLVLKNRGQSSRRVKYEVDSVPGGSIQVQRGIDRDFYLRLPSRFSPRMAALGEEIAVKGKNAAERMELLNKFYLSSGIRYANTGLPMSSDPLDEFLFVKKQGNCEFFAASYALLLRAAGVPSRLVGGYLGGDYNELGGYYLVTEDMAHVWVEAYLPGSGWVTVDPSTYAGGFKEVVEQRQAGLGQRMGMLLDTFNYYWDLAVISYDLERQFRLARNAGFRLKRLPGSLKWGKTLKWIAVTGTAALVIFLVWKSVGITREERVMRKFLRVMGKRYYIDVNPETGIYRMAEISGNESARRFADLYCSAVFNDRKLTDEEYGTILEILQALKTGSRNRRKFIFNPTRNNADKS